MQPKQNWLWLAAAVCAMASWAMGQTLPSHPSDATPHAAALDKAFEEQLNNATLVGFYSTGVNASPTADQYTIVKITKQDGDNWMFVVRMKIAGKEAELPVMLPVKWAGDTPIITVTDVIIPGMGTYTARVLIYKDHYAGMWTGKDHGGELWGRIEHAGAPTQPAPPPATRPATAPATLPATVPAVPTTTQAATMPAEIPTDKFIVGVTPPRNAEEKKLTNEWKQKQAADKRAKQMAATRAAAARKAARSATQPATPATQPATAPAASPATQPLGDAFRLEDLNLGTVRVAPSTQPLGTHSEVPVFIRYDAPVLPSDFGFGNRSPAEIDNLIRNSAMATQPAQ
jgi:hypothetical protein